MSGIFHWNLVALEFSSRIQSISLNLDLFGILKMLFDLVLLNLTLRDTEQVDK